MTSEAAWGHPAASTPRATRREILRGALAGLASGLAPQLFAADPLSLPLITRPIPASGERLPVIGIGTNAFRDPLNPAYQEVLDRMNQLGGKVIDTAANYGESEGIIGNALSALDIRSQMFIATKFDARGVARPGPVFGDTVWGRSSFDRSLLRLHTDHVDLLQAHQLASVEPLMPLMTDLRKAGKTRYIGVTTVSSTQHAQLVDIMRRFPIDFVQVDYSIADRSAARSVFPVAVEHKIAVIAAVPLGGRHRSLLPQLVGKPLPSWTSNLDIYSWSQFILKYAISDPAVTCAIPGVTQVGYLEDDQAAGHGRLPDPAQRAEMERVWDRLMARSQGPAQS